jgi:heat shock 70kDa protein 4
VKKTNIPVHELVYGALEPAELEKAAEKEYEMALQDRVMEETKEKKNAVEAYVYDMRNKVYQDACSMIFCRHHLLYLLKGT